LALYKSLSYLLNAFVVLRVSLQLVFLTLNRDIFRLTRL